ncbi:MAG: hypothetical protein EU551_01835 [Promethearchaeota archaeon]|nr:MAG: hypothetical protein EU551_01835 [Candidatus Lokiarchaeota archaeon]
MNKKINQINYIRIIIGISSLTGPEIWVPGPNWHPIYTFLVWLLGGLLILVIFKLLDRLT